MKRGEHMKIYKQEKEKIVKEAGKKMDKLLDLHPKREHSTLMRFYNSVREIDFWINDEMPKIDKKFNK